ncbi:MAG TPA: Cof-type HAD-IIB family hydrolase [Terriglobales bacterium]|nr:Cof-type HAD-IIB family hydrolase [Terriglobales bacterium]
MTLPIRLLAIDIDGTLLNSSFAIDPRDLAALRHVHSLGVEIILCTGRRHTFALPIAQELGFEVWLCSSNGAVTRSSGGEHFHRDLLPAFVARELCEHLKEFRGSTVLTFDKTTKGALVLERSDDMPPAVSKWMAKNAEYIEIVQPIEAALSEDPVQAMICGTPERIRTVEKVVSKFGGLEHITLLKTEYVNRDFSLLDVLNRDCSKGHAVERWAKHRGIAREQVMAIGDNYNDVEMLQYAGVPVIMGNACDTLKQNGWMETHSNDECGVAAALERVMSTGKVN